MISGIDNFQTFQYNGRRLSEFGAVITQRPTIVTAERDISFNEIPYRNGDVIQDNGRYKNVVLKIKIRAVPSYCDMDFQTWCYSITEWLNTAKDYVIYRDSYNPGYFRYGFVTHISEFVAVHKDVYETEIEITCKPFLYRDSGLNPIVLSMTMPYVGAEGTLTNPEKWESEPVITMTGTGTYNIVFGNTPMIAEVTGKMVIDKPNENVTNGSGVACNDKITSIRLPYFKVGDTLISVTRTSGNADFMMEIIPNWRRL